MKATLCVFVVFFAFASASQIAFERESLISSGNNTIFLIRHGEKPEDGGDGLSPTGKKRAECLRKVFGASSKYKLGKIMAQKPKESGSQARPYETVKKLAEDLGFSVDTTCKRDDTDCVVSQVNDWNRKHQGNILICWEHKTLTDIATALGIRNAPEYPGDHFDLIWTVVDKKIVATTSEKCPGLDPQ